MSSHVTTLTRRDGVGHDGKPVMFPRQVGILTHVGGEDEEEVVNEAAVS